jgi:uncharacterized protein YndB with AHSA1/START domain
MDGTIRSVDGGYELRFERRLTHPVEVVWEALVDPEQRAAWFFAGTLEPHIGGRVDLTDSEHGIVGTVTEADPPHLLAFTWSSHDAPTSTVRFELADDAGSGCILTFSHTAASDARPEYLLPGWHCIFDDLPKYLDRVPVADMPGRFAALQEKYGAVVRQLS